MIKDKITLELKRRFIDAIEATIRTGKEHTFLICKNAIGELRPTQICEGTEFRVFHDKLQCPFTTEGNFHTHPDIANSRKMFSDMSDEEIKEFVIDLANYFGKSIPDPGHGDLVYALYRKLYKNGYGTVCVGSDANTDIVSCWTVKDELTKEDINMAIENIVKEAEKGEIETIEYKDDWINYYFDKETIDLKQNTYSKCHVKFRKSTIDKMKELVSKSQIDEHGGTFCLDRESKVNIRNICKGDVCGVKIEGDCQQGEIKIGEFHSHPHFEIPPFSNEIPSAGDWSLWINRNYFLTCIGTQKGTVCYQKKRDLTTEETNKIEELIRNMEIAESDVNIDPPDYQQPEITRIAKYNKELEEYYYKFSPEECSE